MDRATKLEGMTGKAERQGVNRQEKNLDRLRAGCGDQHPRWSLQPHDLCPLPLTPFCRAQY